jgi:threonine dehydrogenase-like Zn-dependent dehydrogenase
MLGARFYAAGDWRVEEVAEPVPDPDELLVRVRACSMCGTDLKIFLHGHHRLVPPRILGHEIAGEVAATGAGVTDWQPGDRVQVAPVASCGQCADCAGLFAGLPKDSPPVSLDTNLIHHRELSVVGGTGASAGQNARALELIAGGDVAVADLITHRYPLARLPEALAVLRQAAAIKITIQP